MLGKENANSHGAKPVLFIVAMIDWIWASMLPAKNSFPGYVWTGVRYKTVDAAELSRDFQRLSVLEFVPRWPEVWLVPELAWSVVPAGNWSTFQRNAAESRNSARPLSCFTNSNLTLRDTTSQQTNLKVRGATHQQTHRKSTAAKVDTDLPVGLVQRELEMLGIHGQGLFVLPLCLQKSTF